MPSRLHEALLVLFRNRPELAPELLRDALHIELPAYTEARIEADRHRCDRGQRGARRGALHVVF
jgi:hypothetical protein